MPPLFVGGIFCFNVVKEWSGFLSVRVFWLLPSVPARVDLAKNVSGGLLGTALAKGRRAPLEATVMMMRAGS